MAVLLRLADRVRPAPRTPGEAGRPLTAEIVILPCIRREPLLAAAGAVLAQLQA